MPGAHIGSFIERTTAHVFEKHHQVRGLRKNRVEKSCRKKQEVGAKKTSRGNRE